MPATISVIAAPRNGFGMFESSSCSRMPAMMTIASVNPTPAPKPWTIDSMKPRLRIA